MRAAVSPLAPAPTAPALVYLICTCTGGLERFVRIQRIQFVNVFENSTPVKVRVPPSAPPRSAFASLAVRNGDSGARPSRYALGLRARVPPSARFQVLFQNGSSGPYSRSQMWRLLRARPAPVVGLREKRSPGATTGVALETGFA